MLSRRTVVQGLAAAGMALAMLPALGKAAFAEGPSPTDLAVAGPLGDIDLGSKDAKVTIYEYASMTCTHCAAFHAHTWPTLKSKYIDTGKVRFVMREFPLDPLATAGFMLARCAGNDKYYAVIDLLFDQQKNWAFTDKPLEALLGLMKQAGFSQESFMACLKNQEIYDGVNWVKDRGAREFKVDSTPTFFIDGQVRRGELSVEELEKILAPLVGG